MTGNSNRVAAARPADTEPLISVMVLAFAADPVARWMYRDPQRYLAYFGRFIRAFAGKAFSTGTAWRIDGNLGGALWLPPGVKPDEDAIAAILEESVPPNVMADVNAMFGEMAAYHPRDPHWYLPTIGIEPHLHRRGLGSALLTEGLSRGDRGFESVSLQRGVCKLSVPRALRRSNQWRSHAGYTSTYWEAVQERLDASPEAMRVHRETVEHPFGTMKARLGATHFLMKTLPKVATEIALSVLAYNLTRVMNIVGVKPLTAAIGA